MPVIDDEGRIFGTINIIDALVVLLVVAIGVAGIALVTSGGGGAGDADSRTETRHVTVDFGMQPEYVVEQLSTGDTSEPGNGVENATVTELYVAPGENGVRTIARVAVTGHVSGQVFTYDGSQLRLGRTMAFTTASSAMNGTITAFGDSRDLATGSYPILVSNVVEEETARALSSGDTYTIAGRDVATIENVSIYGTENASEKRVFVGVSIETLEEGQQRRFGGRRVGDISTTSFLTETYGFDGRVVRVGSSDLPGEPATRTATLKMRNVPPERAAGLESGMAEQARGETVARVTDVSVESATVAVTSESGELFEREHPINKTVTLTAEIRVRETADRTLFKGRILQNGDTISLDLGTKTLRATVVEFEQS